ncbi:hypothetical protein LTR15_009103 [Elasticomyces elasticus]|nr:hypothetical protein LTR15_009103 [Elasticomyces elasticus]
MLSLWWSLCCALYCIVHSVAIVPTNDSVIASQNTTSTGVLASHVLAGLGSTPSRAPTSSAVTQTPTNLTPSAQFDDVTTLASSNCSLSASCWFTSLHDVYYPWHLPSGGSGNAYASSCLTEWSVYSVLYDYSTPGPVTTTTDEIENIVYDTYTLCDGVPRAKPTVAPSLYTATASVEAGFMSFPDGMPNGDAFDPAPEGLITYTDFSTFMPKVNYSRISPITTRRITLAVPAYPRLTHPACSLGPSDCSSMWSSYNQDTMTNPDYSESTAPPCLDPRPNAAFDGPQCHNGCEVGVLGTVRLFYWPVTMTGNFCGNRSTVTRAPDSAPRTIATLGTTMVEGSAYISYMGVQAEGNDTRAAFSAQCGTNVPPGIVAIASSELFSYSYAPGVHSYAVAPPARRLNFADLPPNPVPAKAWSAGVICNDGNEIQDYCSTITDDAYVPAFVIPTQIMQLNPLWSDCTVRTDFYALYDPPVALTQVEDAAGPTIPVATTTAAAAQAESTPATPASSTVAIPGPTSLATEIDEATSLSQLRSTATVLPENLSGVSSAQQASGDPAASSIQAVPASKSESAAGAIASLLGQHTLATGSTTPTTTTADPQPAPGAASDAVSSVLSSSRPNRTEQDTVPSATNSVDPSAAYTITAGQETTIGDLPVSVGGGSRSPVAMIGGQSFYAGEETVINGTPVSVASNGVIALGQPTGHVLTAIGGQAISLDPSRTQAIVAGSLTLIPGGTAAIVEGTTISAGSAGLVIDGTNVKPSTAAQSDVSMAAISGAVLTDALGQLTTVLQLNPGVYALGSKSLTFGQVVTLDNGQVASVACSSALAVDGSSVHISALQSLASSTGAQNSNPPATQASSDPPSTENAGGSLSSSLTTQIDGPGSPAPTHNAAGCTWDLSLRKSLKVCAFWLLLLII